MLLQCHDWTWLRVAGATLALKSQFTAALGCLGSFFPFSYSFPTILFVMLFLPAHLLNLISKEKIYVCKVIKLLSLLYTSYILKKCVHLMVFYGSLSCLHAASQRFYKHTVLSMASKCRNENHFFNILPI